MANKIRTGIGGLASVLNRCIKLLPKNTKRATPTPFKILFAAEVSKLLAKRIITDMATTEAPNAW